MFQSFSNFKTFYIEIKRQYLSEKSFVLRNSENPAKRLILTQIKNKFALILATYRYQSWTERIKFREQEAIKK